ncbi:J domain-containing protein [Pelagibius litoralis]|uniref:J domain-containing protein n=1 Tax=Pelagibius litoralis TaxID=374515 RepID=A0A967F2R2_9PROT|nr:J domain-containing protein [Pelagibius litoralis]NIA71830.1 J domain-containing protein [Pelagibius litoralis]
MRTSEHIPPPTDRDEDGGIKLCDRPGCLEHGQYRAPRSREALNSYYWFCLEHVREYNLAWDYFKDMGEDSIEEIRRGDAVWQRPTWPFAGRHRTQGGAPNGQFRDDFGFFEEEAAETAGRKGRFPPNSKQAKALAALNLNPNATLEEVKARYKTLAKELHPDRNGGDSLAEERLKIINLAYSDLKAAF